MAPDQSTLTFKPNDIVFFGRTTCGRPVPNLRGGGATGNPALDIKAGFLAVNATGQAKLVEVAPNTGRIVATAPVKSDFNDASGTFAVSVSDYVRTIGSLSTYKVVYDVILGTNTGYTAWISDPPANCRMGGPVGGYGTNFEEQFLLDHGAAGGAVTCHLESAPFYIGPNPGTPKQ